MKDSDSSSEEYITCNRHNSVICTLESKYFSYDDLINEIHKLTLVLKKCYDYDIIEAIWLYSYVLKETDNSGATISYC